MPSFTTDLKGREPHQLKLSEKEAWDMYNRGFRFSIFDPIEEEHRPSLPYRLLQNLTRDTITIEQ